MSLSITRGLGEEEEEIALEGIDVAYSIPSKQISILVPPNPSIAVTTKSLSLGIQVDDLQVGVDVPDEKIAFKKE